MFKTLICLLHMSMSEELFTPPCRPQIPRQLQQRQRSYRARSVLSSWPVAELSSPEGEAIARLPC